jgi:hypothetical protein
MAFKANLTIEGVDKPLKVLDCKYKVKQATDHEGRPSSEMIMDAVEVTFELNGDSKIYEFVADPRAQKDITIEIESGIKDGVLDKLELKKAYAIGSSVNVNTTDNRPAIMTLFLNGADEYLLKGVSLKNPRPELS